jgi:shikimate kinase
VLDPDSRRALRANGVVVWLQAPASVLSERVAGDGDRPLLRDTAPITTLERLALTRAPAYEAAAHAVVDTAGRDVDDVARLALDVLATATS